MSVWLIVAIVVGALFAVGFFALLGWVIHFLMHFMDGW